MDETLKPCPFCADGGSPKFFQYSCWSGVIKCIQCDAFGPCWTGYSDPKKEAIKAWNTRRDEPK